MKQRITDEMYAAIPGLIADGKIQRDIAAMYGVTVGTLRVLCSRRGISLRSGGRRGPPVNRITADGLPGLSLTKDVLKSLRDAACAMDRSATRLASDLLEKIASDDLFAAVLDEAA